jgi:hypothetical protein
MDAYVPYKVLILLLVEGPGIARDYGLDGHGSISGSGILFSTASRPVEANPASYPVGTGGLSPGVNRPGREIDRSSPSSAGVKNVGSILPRLHTFTWCGV